MVVTIISVILVFCLLILSHEFGHFIAAKACGIYVDDFSLGMGPKIAQFKGKETTYTLRPFPIGGWCKMRGEDEESVDPRSFKSRKLWQQMLTIAAGPLMNFILAITIFVVVFMMMGTASGANVIGEVGESTPAAAAGLQPGDRIMAINGLEIDEWVDISAAVNAAKPGGALSLAIERDGRTLQTVIEPYFDEEMQTWLIGIIPQKEHLNFFRAIWLGCVQSVQFSVAIIQGLAQMISGAIPADVAGPVGIVTLIGQASEYGIQSLLILTAYLSINLGLINLFPLPALDGSRLVFLTIEGLRGKPINQAKEGMIHFVGLILLFGLMIFITYKDILRLVTG
ncbi:MAG: RIP metalloprotease RseP [Clostridia bacterium]|mgnify:CR=1 FL=1|nr:RIP metalloprotease RseP [Clostridia bacterium]